MLLSWNVTRQCNLDCRHCYRDAGERDPEELTTREARDFIEQVADCGFRIIILSGGEPLMRPDIYELIAHAADCGLRPVLGTNGTLIGKGEVRRLRSAGIARVGISLDSRQPGYHDSFRRVEGSWARALEAMDLCCETGLEFQVHTTVTGNNWRELEEITKMSVGRGARAHHIFFLIPTGRGQKMEREALAPVQYEDLLHKIMEKQREVPIELKPTCAPQFMRIAREQGIKTRFSRGCLAGTGYCCVLPNGDLHPCPYLPLRVGNVRESSFVDLWKTSEVFETIRSDDFGGRCGRCRYKTVCAGCRARAYYYQDQDYMAEDPWCLYGGDGCVRRG